MDERVIDQRVTEYSFLFDAARRDKMAREAAENLRKSLKPFSEGMECPKCGDNQWGCIYYAANPHEHWPERLAISCNRCKYAWYCHPRDHANTSN